MTHGLADAARGLGVADLAYAIRNHRTPRTGGELTRHVLEAALGICESSKTGAVYSMRTSVKGRKRFVRDIQNTGN